MARRGTTRSFLALCILFIAVTILAVPGLARDFPSYALPWVPPGSDPSLRKEAQNGALALLRANCDLSDAHSALISGDVDKANRLIGKAVEEYMNGAASFSYIPKSKEAKAPLHVPNGAEVDATFQSLERYNISAPKTYGGAYAGLSTFVFEEAGSMKDERFKGERTDIQILQRLVSAQGAIAEVFLDMTILTVFAST